MKRWPWGFLFLWAPVVGGCGPAPTAPVPPVDTAASAPTETATFALG